MSEIYKTDLLPFGHAMLQYFLFDPQYVNLNHGEYKPQYGHKLHSYVFQGSYGSLPKPVFEAAHKLSLKIESNPDYFHRLHYQPLLTEAREKLAKLIGAKTDECVLVTNTSIGIATILRNFEWEEGDVILCSTSLLWSSVYRR